MVSSVYQKTHGMAGQSTDLTDQIRMLSFSRPCASNSEMAGALREQTLNGFGSRVVLYLHLAVAVDH